MGETEMIGWIISAVGAIGLVCLGVYWYMKGKYKVDNDLVKVLDDLDDVRES